MKIYDAIVIGTGAAGYSAADWLFKFGVKNIAVITENRLSGTSRNTGSDKQTYYKISLDGKGADSADKMAHDILSGGSCDGVLAYKQAANSVRCFMRLVEYGVPFPTDEYGNFPGYKTDHDNTSRATSAGPLTSKFMTERLEDVVLNKNQTELLDGLQVIKILVKDKHAFGVLAWNENEKRIDTILAHNIIAATGAPACIYARSVYPESQHGMTGVLIEAGVRLCNFAEWQYGLASIDFRWNVSGSFMQVIPRLISISKSGAEKEFLCEYFGSPSEAFDTLFLKGYQWPFSVERLNGSSKIDMAVHTETSKGNKVFLDYTKNPSGFSFDELSDEAKDYLTKADATGDSPIERLKQLNPKAIKLYAENGINIENEYLRIDVCAQHNNGGVYVDENFESDIKGLYVCGEAAGVFGLTRPGGTALNDTQVSSLVVAKRISENPQKGNIKPSFADAVRAEYEEMISDIRIGEAVDYRFIAKKMSDCAGFLRSREKCEGLLRETAEILQYMNKSSGSVSRYFYDRDMLISTKALLEVIISGMSETGSRGGAVLTENGRIIDENIKYRRYLTVSKSGTVDFVKVNAPPEQNLPFEYYLNNESDNN